MSDGKFNLIITAATCQARDFARMGLACGEREWRAITSHSGGGGFDGFTPKNARVFYLWTRPTPLYIENRQMLDEAKARGFRPIIVTDW